MRKALEELRKEETDTSSLQDDIDFQHANQLAKDELDRERTELAFRQNKIDKLRIAVIYKALEKGVPIDDEVYYQALEVYPQYK